MGRPATVIALSEPERVQLERWVRQPKTERRYAERARMVLLAAAGVANLEIARRLATRPARVSKWRTRFEREGLAGLADEPRLGKAAVYDATTRARILAKLDEPPPAGHARWHGGLLARALGDVSADQVWRELRALGISLQRRRAWCVSTDPEFAAKSADVVALYLAPPENAVVLCVDEKPPIQALERAQGWLQLPDGRALTGFNHEYVRHGTSTLFAALEVATGLVRTGHYRRRRRVEFLDFMNQVVADHPADQTLHVILDNLSTHKPQHDRWLQRHPKVRFHFTPTHASWLNQVEVWFSLLSRHALQGRSFTRLAQLPAAIDAYVAAYNATAHPFAWTRVSVRQKSLASKYASLHN
jgi:transposase